MHSATCAREFLKHAPGKYSSPPSLYHSTADRQRRSGLHPRTPLLLTAPPDPYIVGKTRWGVGFRTGKPSCARISSRARYRERSGTSTGGEIRINTRVGEGRAYRCGACRYTTAVCRLSTTYPYLVRDRVSFLHLAKDAPSTMI